MRYVKKSQLSTEPITTDSEYSLNDYTSLVKALLKQLDVLPDVINNPIKKELDDLIRLLEDIRPPRFMVIGIQNAGKSSLINAIFNAPVAKVGTEVTTGQAKWYNFDRDGKRADILDTRGVLEGNKPKEKDSSESPEASIMKAIVERCPDVLLFVCQAKAVNSGIQETLNVVEKITVKIHEMYDYRPPIVGVVTQCDQLDPPYIIKLPTDNKEKNENINLAVKTVTEHFRNRRTLNTNFVGKVMPVASFVRFREKDGTPDEDSDLRWNIDRLTELLVDELPKGPDIAFARLAKVKKFQRKVAGKVIGLCSTACGAVATSPIPMSDLPLLMSVQLAMIVVIGYISGRELSFKAAGEFLAAFGINLGSGFVLKQAARSMVKLLPGFGSVVSAGVAFAGTQALGKAAVAYFIDNISSDKAKQEYDSNIASV
ncbi:MAG: hypothetical protein HC921_18830 [Synechococcaceae cyanobacterium SM2_3_1]|nr:hypothetical protein [Synechococcaceae cyanobacterium SM2_3_1]